MGVEARNATRAEVSPSAHEEAAARARISGVAIEFIIPGPGIRWRNGKAPSLAPRPNRKGSSQYKRPGGREILRAFQLSRPALPAGSNRSNGIPCFLHQSRRITPKA